MNKRLQGNDATENKTQQTFNAKHVLCQNSLLWGNSLECELLENRACNILIESS